MCSIFVGNSYFIPIVYHLREATDTDFGNRLGSSQSKAYGSPFLYDPSLGGFNPNVSSLLGNPQLDPIPPLPYSTHLDAPGSGKAQSYTDSYMPSHSSPYTNASVKAYAKHLSNKKKSAKKAPGMFSPAHVHDVEYDTSGLYPYGKYVLFKNLCQVLVSPDLRSD